MIQVGLFIYVDGIAKRIELFKDETISVTSSIQNIADITKVFTDFSQSFTVPASDANNAIFKHWYENSIDSGFDARTRKQGYIELNTIPFRTGKIQLEKATIKNGEISNYQISFVGSLVSLKDQFNDRYLRDFDFSTFDFAYSGTVVANRVSGGVTNDVKFPLISSWRVWQWNTSGNSRENWDINKNGTPIYHTDLFPALRVSKIFEIFQAQMGVTFNGDFLTSDKFKRAFLWLKNTDTFVPKATPNKINFHTNTSTVGTQGIFNVFNDSLQFTKPTYPNYVSQSYLTITFTTSGSEFTVFTYRDGIVVNQQSYLSQTTAMTIPIPLSDSGSYSFYIASTTALTFSSGTSYFYEARTGSAVVYEDVTAASTSSQTLTNNLSVGSYMPNIKAQDFFAGILKMFNLTCYATADNVYTIEQIDDWYDNGNILLFDQYVIGDEWGIERVKPYKAINFSYKESQNLLATEFLSRSSIPYGDMKYDTNSDGEDFSVELPFENLLFNKLDTNIQVSYAIKSDYSTYIPEPVVLYDWGTIVTTGLYHINDGSATNSYTSLNVFGQDTSISSVKYSLNWNAEQSTFTDQIEENSLFKTYYLEYLSNLFTDKARVLKLKAKLPISLLNSLKLNDRLILRDKRYLINSFTTDLTSGTAEFELLNDFRVPTNIPEPTVAYAFSVTNGNSTSSTDACGLSTYSLTIYGSNSVFEDNGTFYTNATLSDINARFNGGGYYFKNAESKWVVIDANGNKTNSGTCSVVPPTPTYAFQVTNANSTSSANACPITDYTLTIYAYDSVFINNTEFFANQSLAQFNGNNYYFHCNDGTWAKIGTTGLRLEFGVCSVIPPVLVDYYIPKQNSILS